MSMFQLALQNVKSSMKNCLTLILSLAFTILVFLNFQNIVFSDVLAVLGRHNQEYTNILVETISVVLGCFMFFFTGYATNVFLTRRKKEIGIYIFMGLGNEKIGRLYMIEMTLVGLATLFAGTGSGILFTQLFQMILLSISDISVDIGFHFSWQSLLITCAFFLTIYLFYVCKGYVNIVRSSVLSLVSASRRNEYVNTRCGILVFKAVLGAGLTGAGYYLAIRKGGQEVMANVLMATILVICGVYFLFGGFLPLCFQGLAAKKTFLYRRQRCLWVSQLIFRMKKNYRTYAMVCVLMICSVTALSTSFAMKLRYDNIIHFRNTYTYQLLSDQPDLDKKAEKAIEAQNDISFHTKIRMLSIMEAESENSYALVPYSGLKQLAEDAGLEFDADTLQDDETVKLEHLYLLSLLTDRTDITVTMHGKDYRQVTAVNVPYLGYLQESMTFYLVSDREFERLTPSGTTLYIYSYRIKDIYNFRASLKELDTLVSDTPQNYTGRIVSDPQSSDIEWIRIFYSLGIFMFLVFVMAGGCILLMKIINDAYEEQARYSVLQKMGFDYKTLKKSVSMELSMAYLLPFLIMIVSSYFSVHALENMMYTSLLSVWLVSTGVIFVLFFFCYRISVRIYLGNAMPYGRKLYG